MHRVVFRPRPTIARHAGYMVGGKVVPGAVVIDLEDKEAVQAMTGAGVIYCEKLSRRTGEENQIVKDELAEHGLELIDGQIINVAEEQVKVALAEQEASVAAAEADAAAKEHEAAAVRAAEAQAAAKVAKAKAAQAKADEAAEKEKADAVLAAQEKADKEAAKRKADAESEDQKKAGKGAAKGANAQSRKRSK